MPVDVATFLLNENRTDVLNIETRFKVNVLLVPNRHLETPNYTIERLRHEDLNQAEPLPLSFDMVKQPEQIDLARQKKEEATAAPRQEAMVKGITPAQPAPIPVERATAAADGAAAPATAGGGSWLTRMMNWFNAKPEAPAAAPAPARRDSRSDDRGGDKARDGRRDSRSGDNRDRKRGEGRNEGRRGGDQRRDEPRDGSQGDSRNRRDGRGGDRNERNEQRGEKRGDNRNEQRTEGTRQAPQPRDGKPQGEARRDGNRPPRESAKAPRESGKPPRVPRGESALVADTVNATGIAPAAPPQNDDGGEAREGNRRRRGRRGRGGDRPDQAAAPGDNLAEAGDGAQSVVDTLSMMAASEVMAPEGAPQQVQETRAPREPRPPREPRQPREAREQREPRPPREQSDTSAPQPAPAVAEATRVATASLFEDTPAVLPPVAVKPVETPRLPAPQPMPAIALTLPANSGLELVETRFKAPAPADETPEPPRPKRVRPPRVEIASEPLEIIETTKGSPPPLN
jgi:ribonuclease E